jgi:hypothetical protein
LGEIIAHSVWVLALTLLTQLGGLASRAAIFFCRRWLAFSVF